MINIKHFKGNINSINDLKNIYRKKSFEMHPDKGGSVSDMQELNFEYNWIKENFYTYTLERDRIESIVNLFSMKANEFMTFKNISIELIDECIWITGKTFDIKERLKKSGFKFSSNNKAWYWTKYGYYQDSNINLSHLKMKYNSIKIL